MPLDHLWATWRSAYVGKVVDTRTLPTPEEAAGRSLFERILAGADEEGDEVAGVLWRGDTCFALLNLFPYTAGHLMVLPQRAVADLEDLTDDEHAELWGAVRDAVVALKAAFHCDAVNVGREPRRGRRRVAVRPPPRALRAPLGGRRQLHRGRGRDPGAARSASRRPAARIRAAWPA